MSTIKPPSEGKMTRPLRHKDRHCQDQCIREYDSRRRHHEVDLRQGAEHEWHIPRSGAHSSRRDQEFSLAV